VSARLLLASRLRRWRFAIGVAIGALGLSACARGVPTSDAPSSIPPVPVTLATSIQTSGGTWATVPMGHLNDPLNTFWQLFFRPAGATTWSDKVEPTATATNGGLVLASSAGDLLVVGIRPSYDLVFTPIITTADSGQSWSTGLLDHMLAANPNALAVESGGHALAIAHGRGGDEVLSSTGGLSSWQRLITQEALRSEVAGQSCGPSTITAVGYADENAVVGASCTRPGVVGMFLDRAGSWDLVGPRLPSSLAQGRVSVLGLDPVPGGLAALLAISRPEGTSLVASWTSDGSTWQDSRPLDVPSGQHLISYGPAAGSGLFVLLAGSGGADRLEAINAPGAAWLQLPPPPANTATVAYSAAGVVDALAVNDTVLTVWTLASPSDAWTRSQVIHVPIQFGSSKP